MLALALALLASAAARADQAWIFEPGQALVRVEMGAARARFSATSVDLSGRVIERAAGGVQAQIRIALASFGTGVAARDEKLQHQGDAEHYPEIVFEGTAPAEKDGTLRLQGTLTFHGASRPLTVPVEVVRAAGLKFGHATLTLHLREFGFALPEGASDEVRIDVDAGLRPEAAIASSG
jgi:polyisoprenoid-binding protein YceI